MNIESLNRRKVLKYGLWGGVASLGPGIWVGGCASGKRNKRPNIILITVDTLRPDHLGCYGYAKNTSPNLDKFAKEGMVFQNCLSHAPETRFSFASILTGFLPHETKVMENIALPAGVGTLAEYLGGAGYRTAAVISNFVLMAKGGWSQGFSIYDDSMTNIEVVRKWPEKVASNTTDQSIELLKKLRKEPFFLWIHYQDPHGPYTPPQPFDEMFVEQGRPQRDLAVKDPQKDGLKSLSGRGGIPSYQQLGDHSDYHYYVDRYDGEIRYQDEEFGRLVEAMKEIGLYDNSFIMFTSDHGEGMGEHDYFFAHGENLHSDQTHVPLILKHGSELAGQRAEFVQHIDIVPTVLDVAGIETDSRFRGRDLRYPVAGSREIFAEMNSPLVPDGVKFSVVFDGAKLIYTPLLKEYLFYDIASDPYEERNLIGDSAHIDMARDLQVRMVRLMKEDTLGLRQVGSRQELSAEELEKLKSLGYVR